MTKPVFWVSDKKGIQTSLLSYRDYSQKIEISPVASLDIILSKKQITKDAQAGLRPCSQILKTGLLVPRPRYKLACLLERLIEEIQISQKQGGMLGNFACFFVTSPVTGKEFFSMRQWPFIIQNQCDILKTNVTFSNSNVTYPKITRICTSFST